MIYCAAYITQPCKDIICCRRCEKYEQCRKNKCLNNPETCGKIDWNYSGLKNQLLQKIYGSEDHEEIV